VLGLPVWLVELSPSGPVARPRERTMVRLRAMLPRNTPRVAKQRFNAFEGTDLLARIHNAMVLSYLVVMGHEVNCCVKQTAIGGSYKPSSPFVEGATGNGFKVLTCDDILSINSKHWDPVKADWWDHMRVEYYASL